MSRYSTDALTKSVPNALSISRIPLSLSLLFMKPFSATFVLIYLTCGLTDALDGHLARKFHAESQLGAKIDSIADFTFFAVALYVFLTALLIPPVLLVWAFAVVFARFIGLGAAFAKFRSWAALHTDAFRIVAFSFFCFPLFSAMLGTGLAGAALCLMATLATGEEIYINVASDSLDPNIRNARQLHGVRLLR